jgi:osmotically-inducible protein OsmY
MNQLKKIVMLAVAVMFATLVGCASTPTHDSTGQFVDDATITTKIKADILGADDLKVLEIKVVTFKGVVQLSGFVRSEHDIHHAVEIARNTRGVVRVDNDMRLK